MKSILLPIKPIWCALMMNGDKTIEVRTSKALAKAIQKLIDKYGYADIYVYCTKDKEKLYDDYPNVCSRYKSSKRYILNDFLNGKVVFKFRCYKVEEIECAIDYDHECGRDCTYHTDSMCQEVLGEHSCLYNDIDEYLDWKPDKIVGYAIHISDLEIFEKPKELSEFNSYSKCKRNLRTRCLYCHALSTKSGTYCIKPLTKAPQNFCYVESEELL